MSDFLLLRQVKTPSFGSSRRKAISSDSSVKELSDVSSPSDLSKDKIIEKSQPVPLPEIQSSKQISSGTTADSILEKNNLAGKGSGSLKSDKE